MQVDLQRIAVDSHRLAEVNARAQIGNARVARAYGFKIRWGKQPLREDVLAQLGSSGAQQLVQAVRAEQIQVVAVDVVRHVKTCTRRAFSAPFIVDAIETRLMEVHGSLRRSAPIADALVIKQQADECDHRHA